MTTKTCTPGTEEGVDRWLAAMHASPRRLADVVDGLSEAELSLPSMADGWSIAQVLSHLGSAAEISTGLLEGGVAGDQTGPERAAIVPVWQRWDALSGTAQREAWRAPDARHLQLLDVAGPVDP